MQLCVSTASDISSFLSGRNVFLVEREQFGRLKMSLLLFLSCLASKNNALSLKRVNLIRTKNGKSSESCRDHVKELSDLQQETQTIVLCLNFLILDTPLFFLCEIKSSETCVQERVFAKSL